MEVKKEAQKEAQNKEADVQKEEEKPKEAVSEKAHDSIKEIEQKMESLVSSRLASKQKELEVLEDRIDRKISSFKRFVEDTEVQGKSLAQMPETEKEKMKRDDAKLLKGTGMTLPDEVYE